MNIRKTTNDDLNEIYELHNKCFKHEGDRLYKTTLIPLLENGIVTEINNKIVGILLQAQLIVCDVLPVSMESIDNTNDNYLQNIIENTNEIKYDIDSFIPLNEIGIKFKNDNKHINPMYGIALLFVDPEYRHMKIATSMINYHIENNETAVCLHVRKSNIEAISLYDKLSYIHIGNIINKYYNPTETSCFYIHN